MNCLNCKFFQLKNPGSKMGFFRNLFFENNRRSWKFLNKVGKNEKLFKNWAIFPDFEVKLSTSQFYQFYFPRKIDMLKNFAGKSHWIRKNIPTASSYKSFPTLFKTFQLKRLLFNNRIPISKFAIFPTTSITYRC